MHKVCWCGGKAMHKQANSLAFEDFMTRPFIESSPKFWLGETRYDPLGGTPDADTKTPCGTLMQCRALKYLNFLNVSTWALNVVFVRFEDVSSPDESSAWIQSLASRYRLELQGDAVKQTTGYKGYSYKGAKQFDAVAARAKMLWFTPQLLEGTESAGKVELVSRLMDADVERLVGYAPLAHTRRDALTAAADRIMAAVAKPGRPRADGARGATRSPPRPTGSWLRSPSLGSRARTGHSQAITAGRGEA
ncbi:hypothetical protein FOA52_014747 [Chlamydomonas sp. UWO 241]|nr:hypothetical protein FOA52_014747 [Chlamydomonas sp. UWO 241]